VDGPERIDARDRIIYDTYRPHFKRITGMEDAPLEFELPGFDQAGESGDGEHLDELDEEAGDAREETTDDTD